MLLKLIKHCCIINYSSVIPSISSGSFVTVIYISSQVPSCSTITNPVLISTKTTKSKFKKTKNYKKKKKKNKKKNKYNKINTNIKNKKSRIN